MIPHFYQGIYKTLLAEAASVIYLARSALQTVPLGDCSWGHLFGEKGDARTSSRCEPWERLFASVSEIGFQMLPFLKW